MIRIIFENKKLLNEVNMEKVRERFTQNDFLNAFNKGKDTYTYGSGRLDKGATDNLKKIFAKQDILEAIPRDISEADKAHALNWLITTFIRTDGMTSPGSKKDLEHFFQIKSRRKDFLSKKDIYSIKDYNELKQVVEDALPSWTEYNISQDDKNAEKGMHKIHEDDDWKIYIPENKAAACKLGDGADWCTAARGLSYYEGYHSPDDPLIIFVSKKETFTKKVKVYNKKTKTEEEVEKTFPVKYQFYYGISGRQSPQFMDKDDKSIRTPDKIRLFYRLNYILSKVEGLPESVRAMAKEKGKNFDELPDGGMKVYEPNSIAYYDEKQHRHREDGPALIKFKHNIDENKPKEIVYEEWYKHGYKHREDGPAYVNHVNGIKIWYIDGNVWRLDGPAYVSPNEVRYYWDNKEMSKEEYEKKRDDYENIPIEESKKRKSLRIIFN